MKLKNYEIFKGEDLIIADLIQRRRYQILVHSCLYYYLHTTIVEDFQWDIWAKELVDLQKTYPEISKQVTLYEYYEDFDGSTGFDLPIEEDWVVGIANRLLRNYRGIVTYHKTENKSKVIKKSGKRRLF